MKCTVRFTGWICAVLLLFALSAPAYAIDFDAETAYESIFVIYSGNSIGSGFAIGPNAVVTNAHVVDDADDILLQSYEGKTYRADVHLIDETLDLAVLRVHDADFVPLEPGDCDALKIGDDIYAIGAPQSMSYTLTEKPASAPKMDDKKGRASDAYKKAFWNQLRSKNPMTPELRNALEEGEVAEGGYLVPDTFEHTLIQGLTENGVIRAHARVITTSGGLHKIPVVASHGSASWIDEEGDYLESDESFGQVQLDAHKVGTVIKVSEELLQDSAFNLESYMLPLQIHDFRGNP